jgi:hypothetical protein
MSSEALKRVRDEVVAGDIALHLETTKKLIAAIDEHITATDVSIAADRGAHPVVDSILQAKAADLEAEVEKLQAQVDQLKTERATITPTPELAPKPATYSEDHK